MIKPSRSTTGAKICFWLEMELLSPSLASSADKLQVEVYFPDPHAPWQRGTNENTNGLLREYFPKGSDLTDVEETVIQEWEDKLNHRSRECLNWKTPYEVFYDKIVHLI